jgi:hypothetical protein
MHVPKPIFILSSILAVVIGGPIIVLLTLVEIAGLFFDSLGTSDGSYQLSYERFATINKQGKVSWWQKNALAIAGYHEGLASYREASFYDGSARFEEPGEPDYHASSGGFIDANGKKLPIKLYGVTKWTYLGSGLAPVFDPYVRKYCFIDKSGQRKIREYFEDAHAFSDGLAAVSVARAEDDHKSKLHNGKWGYIDPSGHFVIEPRFSTAGQFHAGRALVAELDAPKKVLVIDKHGKKAFENHFAKLSEYSPDGFAIFNNNDSFYRYSDLDNVGLIDVNGNTVLKGFALESYSDGVATVHDRQSSGYHFIDKVGRPIPNLAQGLSSFGTHAPELHEGYASIANEVFLIGKGKHLPAAPKVSFIDQDGKPLALALGEDRIVTAAFPFNNGLAVIRTYILNKAP